MIARLTGWLPGAPISWDQWLMIERDNVVAGGGTGFEPFGSRPAPLAAVAEGWLASYRQRGRWARVESPY
jgi:NADH dehydrogenase